MGSRCRGEARLAQWYLIGEVEGIRLTVRQRKLIWQRLFVATRSRSPIVRHGKGQPADLQ